MKRIVFALAFFALIYCFPLAANANRDWSKEDRAWFATELVLAGVDFWQTTQFDRAGLSEANPIYKGAYRDPARLVLVMSAIHIAEYLLLDKYPEARKILPYQVGFHLAVVGWNRRQLEAQAGVKIPF